MQNAQERLIASWAQVEYSDISFLDGEIDELPETAIEHDAYMLTNTKKKKKRDRRQGISAVISFLTGYEVEVKAHTAFRKTEKEFVMRPLRSVEEHEKHVQEMINNGYAFDPIAATKPNHEINEPNKFSPRELAPIAQMIFGVLNLADSYQRHNR